MNESWIKSYWRPGMGWTYMAINIFDFIIAPALSFLLPIINKGAYTPWVSLTLTNGGFIHLAFAAILGVAAWSRGKEKLGLNKDGSTSGN
jgi:hypothetical protein